MKSINKYMWGGLLTLCMGLGMTACTDDDDAHVEVSTFSITTPAETAYYGDSIAFSVHADESRTALSVLTVAVVYGEEVMEETTIRTKQSGADYSGKLAVPYFKEIPDGQMKLRYSLLNVDFGLSTLEQEIRVERPDFAYVTLHGEDDDYQLVRTDAYTYALTGELPQKINGYIETPAISGSDKTLTFGLGDDGLVAEGSMQPITFSSAVSGEFTVSFNTKNYAYSPKNTLQANGEDLVSKGNEYYTVDLNLAQEATISFEGLANISEWWIDPDYFTLESGNSLTLAATQGEYRLLIDAQGQYITARVLTAGEPATLQEDGTGAVWIIGEGIGKPNLADYQVGWNTDNALSLAPIGDKQYQVTLVAGEQISINPSKMNFKFFHQANWGGEFTNESLTTDSDVILVGDGENGRDPGNLGFVSEAMIPKGTTYILTLDLSAGSSAATMAVEVIASTLPVEEPDVQVNGQDLAMVGDEVYQADVSLSADQALDFTGLSDLNDWYIDPDFFTLQSGTSVSFAAMAGDYRLVINEKNKFMTARVLSGGELASLQDDGAGAIWIIGEGVGKPNYTDFQVGWNTDNALCLAPIGNKQYRVTLTVGEQLDASTMNFKFFHQAGWGGEFSNATLTTDSDAILVGDGSNGRDPGNLGVMPGVTLTAGSTCIITLDLSGGKDAAIMTVDAQVDAQEPETQQVNGQDLQIVATDIYQADLTLSAAETMTFTGLSDLNGWWIDPDFFTLQSSTSVNLASMAGDYRLIINEKDKYMTARVLADGNPASLQDDGTGALWIIGEGVGKPNFTDHQVGWNTDNALCLAPIGNQQYQVTLTVGQQINADGINFKFFHQAGWGGEFSNANLSTTSDFILVGDGNNGRDPGNLGFVSGASIADGDTFRLTVDVSAGKDAVTLTVEAVN